MMHDHSALAVRSAYTGDADARVRQFLPLVRKLAWLYEGSCGASIDVDDLMQAGLIALTECIRRHERDTDDGFAAYVKTRVRGAMIDLLRAQSALPRGAASLARRADRAAAMLHTETGREPTQVEIALRLGVTVDSLDRLALHQAHRSIPLDDCYSDQDGAFADEMPDAQAQLLQVEDRDRLAAAIAELPERLQLVIKLHFVEELNLTEISAVLDVSVPRVHQLKSAALAKLKLAVVADG